MGEASDEIRRNVLQKILVLEDKISEVENELLGTIEEMRTLTVKKRREKRRTSGFLRRPESFGTEAR